MHSGGCLPSFICICVCVLFVFVFVFVHFFSWWSLDSNWEEKGGSCLTYGDFTNMQKSDNIPHYIKCSFQQDPHQ